MRRVRADRGFSNHNGPGGRNSDDGPPPLERKDYIALVIAALETVLLPLVVAIVVLLVLLFILR